MKIGNLLRSNCSYRSKFKGVVDSNNHDINHRFRNSRFHIIRPTKKPDLVKFPGTWKFEWLPNEQRMDNSVKMENGDTVIIDDFVDYKGVKHEDVFLSFNKFNQSYFVFSPEVGILGFYYSEDSDVTTGPQDTLRLTIYH